MKGLFDVLRGAADAFDVIPGFDPDKDKQGLIGRLLGMPGGAPRTPPIVQPGMTAPAPGGPNPYANYANPRSGLSRFLATNSSNRMHDAGHQNFLDYQAKMGLLNQKTKAAQAERERVTALGQGAGLTGRDLLAFQMNPEKFGAEYAKNYAPQSITAGNTYSMRGGPMQRAPMPNKTTTNALGQPVTIDQNTGRQVGQPIGPMKPMTVASGASLVDPETQQTLMTNTAMTDRQKAQTTNERARLALDREELEHDKTKGTDFGDVASLRKEFTSITADYRQVQDQFNVLNTMAQQKTAQGDLALVVAFTKLLDPGSVAREGEVSLSQSSASAVQNASNWVNRLSKGNTLLPNEVRDGFVKAAEELMGQYGGSMDMRAQEFGAIADRYNINRDDILVGLPAGDLSDVFGELSDDEIRSRLRLD